LIQKQSKKSLKITSARAGNTIAKRKRTSIDLYNATQRLSFPPQPYFYTGNKNQILFFGHAKNQYFAFKLLS